MSGENGTGISASLSQQSEVPLSAWLKLHHLSFARLGICSSCPSQLPILISFYSLFTTDSADNKQRQPRSSENTLWSYLLMADHPITIGKSEVDNWTKDEEAALLSTGLVISSPPTLTAKPLGCDPTGRGAFAPGAPGSLKTFKSPVLQGRAPVVLRGKEVCGLCFYQNSGIFFF
jgi:hypothetical protein